MILLEKTSLSEEETENFAVEIVCLLNSSAKDYQNIIVTGEMGSGKSFLIRAILRCYGVDGPIPSPSFSLIHEYQALPILKTSLLSNKDTKNIASKTKTKSMKFWHLDLYRIQSEEELYELGLEELLEQPGLRFIEWGERFTLALAMKTLTLEIKRMPSASFTKRKIYLYDENKAPASKLKKG